MPLPERLADAEDGPPPVLAVPPEELAAASARPANEGTLALAPQVARAASGARANGDFREIDITTITPSNVNVPHREPDAELCASVKEYGVFEPIMVRAIPPAVVTAADGSQREVSFEIVFGERRWKAAMRAGHASITADVRELTDQEALDLQTEENLHRKDLTPLQEAAVFDVYFRKWGDSAKELARRVHKPEWFVVQRLKLLELPEKARDALAGGQILLGTALEIACLAEKDREAALHHVLPFQGGSAITVRDARNRLAQKFHLRMVQAAFDPTDATLVPAAGACTTCPKRTSNQLALTIEGLDDDDRCTDRACFELKTGAVWERRRAQAEAEGVKVLDTRAEGKEGERARKLVVAPWGANLVNLDAQCDEVIEGDGRYARAAAALVEANDSGDEAAIAAAEEKLDHVDRSPAPTWRELIGDTVKPTVIARDSKPYDPSDTIVELVPADAALQALKARGLKLQSWAERKLTEPKPDGAAAATDDDDGRAKRDRDLRLDQLTRDRFALKLRDALAGAAEGCRSPTKFLLGVIVGLLAGDGAFWGDDVLDLENLCKRRGWARNVDGGVDADKKAVLAAAAKLSEPALRGVVVQLLCSDEEQRDELAQHFAVDTKKIKAAAAKEAKAELEGKAAAKGKGKGSKANGKGAPVAYEQTCHKCGCTDSNACKDTDGLPCSWTLPNTCSKCAGTRDQKKVSGPIRSEARKAASKGAEVSS